MQRIRDTLSRVKIRWHSLIAATSVATPVLLTQLQVIDLKPFLSRYMSIEVASIVVGLMPFYIALLKPMIHIEDRQETDCK
jgi:hypothetical protein